MDPLLTISAITGLVCTGFVVGDWLSRRKTTAALEAAHSEWTESLAKIQALNNGAVEASAALLDRVARLEMIQTGIKTSTR